MTLLILAYLGGVLTILSPCILPVLPFVFARSDQPFLRSGLPMLLGMAVTFAIVATLAAVVGGWAVAANEYGRLAAMVLLAVFGLALLFPSISDRLTRPAVQLGARLSQAGDARPSIAASALLGVATGLLWAPCAGPILGLVLTGAALQGANWQTSTLLLAYAAGAATSLGLAILVGGRLFKAMKRSLGAGEWIRRGLGAAVLVGVAAIALGLDTGLLSRLSTASTAALEQGLLNRLSPEADPHQPTAMSGGPAMMAGGPAMMSGSPAMTGSAPDAVAPAPAGPPRESRLAVLADAVEWINSPPLTAEALRGKVVLIDFWTYSCINCLRTIPYTRAWAEKYRDQGLVVIGVHTPEFAFERNMANVRRAVTELGITYPVAVDSNYAIWRSFLNRYWPAHYFIDAQGRIRHHHFGEGGYEESERVIQSLLAEAGAAAVPTGTVAVSAAGAGAASDEANVRSPETYIGFQRAENFVSPGGAVEDTRHNYTPGNPRLNEWGLSGDWTVGAENAVLNGPEGGITYRFHARDLHLVLGPMPDGGPVRFRVTIDGRPPGENRGTDVDAEGNGTVSEQRLYQLLRQPGAIGDRTFEIHFLDPGVQAYAFTFG
jgi:cytochrome c biogenesis protein CcdA/thiol-disulfide isomerase/thioredoxin